MKEIKEIDMHNLIPQKGIKQKVMWDEMRNKFNEKRIHKGISLLWLLSWCPPTKTSCVNSRAFVRWSDHEHMVLICWLVYWRVSSWMWFGRWSLGVGSEALGCGLEGSVSLPPPSWHPLCKSFLPCSSVIPPLEPAHYRLKLLQTKNQNKPFSYKLWGLYILSQQWQNN